MPADNIHEEKKGKHKKKDKEGIPLRERGDATRKILEKQMAMQKGTQTRWNNCCIRLCSRTTDGSGCLALLCLQVLLFFLVIADNNWSLVDFNINPLIGPSYASLVSLGAKYDPLIQEGEWWRFLCPSFLSAGFAQLFFNFIVIGTIGTQLEKSIGAFRICVIYLSASIYGTFCSLIFLPTMVTVASSSGSFGFIGTYLADLLTYRRLSHPLGCGIKCCGRFPCHSLVGTFCMIVLGTLVGSFPLVRIC